MKKRARKDNGKKARLLQNVFADEITKMRDEGMSYKAVAEKLSARHKKHFSVRWVWKNYTGKKRFVPAPVANTNGNPTNISG